MAENKYYCLYLDREQSKLLTTASSLEILESETEYYSGGVWFEYTCKEGSNLIENEKEMKGIVFPGEEFIKKRKYKEEFGGQIKKIDKNTKWLT